MCKSETNTVYMFYILTIQMVCFPFHGSFWKVISKLTFNTFSKHPWHIMTSHLSHRHDANRRKHSLHIFSTKKKNMIWSTRNITLKTLSFIWRKEIFVHQIFPIKFINRTTLIERATILKRLVHNSWYICTNIACKPCKHYCKYIFYLVLLLGLHYNDDNDYINKEAFHFLNTLPALSAFLKPGLCTMPAGDNFSNSLWRKTSQSFITLEHVHTDTPIGNNLLI